MRTNRLEKMKKEFYKCVLALILHPYPGPGSTFCQQMPKSLYPNVQFSRLMLYARLLIHPFCQLLEDTVYTVGQKRVEKEYRTSRLCVSQIAKLAVREYWMIVRESGFLAVVWFGSYPTPPSPVSKLDRRHTGRRRKRDNLLSERGREGGGGAKSFDGEKAWSSINHSILFAVRCIWTGLTVALLCKLLHRHRHTVTPTNIIQSSASIKHIQSRWFFSKMKKVGDWDIRRLFDLHTSKAIDMNWRWYYSTFGA